MALIETYASVPGAGAKDGSSEADAWDIAGAVAGYAPGDRVNFKDTGASGMASFNLSTDATAGNPIHWRGYTSSIGDGGLATLGFSGGNKPTISGDGIVFEGFDISNSNNIGSSMDLTGGSTVYRCRITNATTTTNTTGFSCARVSGHGRYLKCSMAMLDAPNALVPAVDMNGPGAVERCWIESTGSGIQAVSNDFNIRGNIIQAFNAPGIDFNSVGNTSGWTVASNTISGGTVGINFDGNPGIGGRPHVSLENNLIWNADTYAFSFAASPTTYLLLNNAWGSCPSGFANNLGDLFEIGTVEVSGNPFGRYGQEFALDDTAGEGAACVAAGFPAGFLTASNEDVEKTYVDIGAVQNPPPDYPAEGDVEAGVDYDYGFKSGTFVVPAEGDVEDGIGYGEDGTEFTGTFTEPGVANVRAGISYGAGGTEFDGTITFPLEAQVQNGVGFGSAGTEFTGAQPANTAINNLRTQIRQK